MHPSLIRSLNWVFRVGGSPKYEHRGVHFTPDLQKFLLQTGYHQLTQNGSVIYFQNLETKDNVALVAGNLPEYIAYAVSGRQRFFRLHDAFSHSPDFVVEEEGANVLTSRTCVAHFRHKQSKKVVMLTLRKRPMFL